EELHHWRAAQRSEREAATARADRWQQPARAVADQQQQRLTQRLFEDLAKRVCGTAVHLPRSVDNDDPPSLLGCGQAKKAGNLARILDHDLPAQTAAARIIGPLYRQQVGMAACRYAAKHPAFGIDRQPSVGMAGPLPCLRMQEARQAESKRCLADAARSAQQNGMRQSTNSVEPPQLTLGIVVTDKIRVRPRRRCSGRGLGWRISAAGH